MSDQRTLGEAKETANKETTTHLTFCKMKVQADVTYWMELRRRKLSEWKLSEPVVPLRGMPMAVVTLGDDSAAPLFSSATSANTVVFSRESFFCAPGEETDTPHVGGVGFMRGYVPGELKNYNVLQDLEAMDMDAELFAVLNEKLLVPLVLNPSSRALDDDQEADLWRTAPFLFFVMHAYVDVKNYAVHHCEAFPAMFVDSMSIEVGEGKETWKAGVTEAIQRHSVTRAKTYGASCLYSPFLCVLKGSVTSFAEFSPSRFARLLREREQQQQEDSSDKVMICFRDISANVDTLLGWHMRNFLLCLRLVQPSLRRLSLFAIREAGRGDCLDCTCEPLSALHGDGDAAALKSLLHVTGWRKTSVRVTSISSYMDPVSLAEGGSRLNLELMKWRQLPSLHLDGLAGCRALLLGTGTLGCNVARNLLMWGVRHLTLVDRGTVSYSNLARQSLFTADDAAQGGREKTVAAATALRAIIPCVTAVPVTMTIHMPGHRTDPARAAETRAEIQRLSELIKDHDVVFLLTDSWESRWLPTVLAAVHDTPLINVALGFDSYVVMRHGLLGSDVRCYFCSDVSAPTDSLTMRALDQQCTVTRPGVSSVASALAVELLAAMYQQDPPFGKHRAGDGGRGDGGRNDPVALHSRLGAVPEQIRGSVNTHSTTLLSGKRNPACTACSSGILTACEKEGSAFLLRCIDSPEHIEEVSGLGASKALWEAQNADDDWSCHSSDSDTDA